MFNDDNPITHCEDIYLGHRRAYMHCGKAYGEKCNNDNECSSKVCYENSCQINHKGPSDSEGSGLIIKIYMIGGVIFILLLLLVLYFKSNKKNNNK